MVFYLYHYIQYIVYTLYNVNTIIVKGLRERDEKVTYTTLYFHAATADAPILETVCGSRGGCSESDKWLQVSQYWLWLKTSGGV